MPSDLKFSSIYGILQLDNIRHELIFSHCGRLLGIGEEWKVTDVKLDMAHLKVDIYLDYGEKCAPCPECRTLSPMHDSQEERIWRHLDTMQFTTLIHAKPPRCKCEEHGVKVIDLPWAEKGSRFTLLFEAFADGILAKVPGETGGKAVAQKAEALIDTTLPTDLVAHLNLTAKEGKMKLAAVKVRVNQDIFRKMVLQNYGSKCCITGLSVPDVLRASHISPWAEDEKNRLNPENGLCLSATYDAAFDRHLISFDEHYRLVVSKAIKDHYTDAAAKSYFLDLEGQTMSMPIKFLPSQALLEKHRELLAG